uniref:Uncharacterized protein n=1 Tax=Tetranychus urticae TaxID=32264 RepID=T1JRV8_TETUR
MNNKKFNKFGGYNLKSGYDSNGHDTTLLDQQEVVMHRLEA